MNLKDVKTKLNHVVYYNTGQINFDGCAVKEFILTACVLRRGKKNQFFFQAKLKEMNSKAVIIVPLEKVLNRNEI